MMIDAITTSILPPSVFAVAAFYLTNRFTPPEDRQESNRYHAYYAVSATLFGAFFLFFIIVALKALMPSYHRLFDILNFFSSFAAAAVAVYHSRRLLAEKKRARCGFEKLAMLLLLLSACLAILITGGIVVSVAAEAYRFFTLVPVNEFLFGIEWSPQIAIREDQVGASGSFGLVPVMVGTFLITAIAMFFAAPIGLASAIYLSEFADAKFRARVKPVIELLAGVPTVVYGFFAVVTLSPLLRSLGASIGVDIVGESALVAGIVMGVMLIPFIASLSEDALFAVPISLRQGALALGATRYEAATQVIFPAALSGIVAGLLLAVSRAVGETMIVVMAAGISANLTINPLEAVTTVTVQIVSLLTGDQAFDDPKTLAAFALGLSLLLITLVLNGAAMLAVRRFREHYE